MNFEKLLAEIELILEDFEKLERFSKEILEGQELGGENRNQKLLLRKLKKIVSHIMSYSQSELEMAREKGGISNSFVAAVEKAAKHVQQIDFTDFARFIRRLQNNSDVREELAQVIAILREAREQYDVAQILAKAQRKALRDAKKKAKAQLNPKEIGCYHFAKLSKVLHIARQGIISKEFAENELGLQYEVSNEGFQGEDLISVFDPYTYWKLYISFEEMEILDQIKKGELNEENFRQALRRNPRLGISKNQEAFISFANEHGFFDGMYVERVFSTTFINIRKLDSFPFVTYPADVCLYIEESCDLLPLHDDAYPFEGVFHHKIPPEKIKGIVLIRKTKIFRTTREPQYASQLEEYAKFAGIPLYNVDGSLRWPLD